MKLRWTNKRTWTVIILVLVIGGTAILYYIRENVDYKYFNIESIRPSLDEFNSPSFESFIEIQIDSPKFQRLVNEIKSKQILSIEGWGNQIGPEHFFVRGYKSFEKPFFTGLFSKFKFWYVVFEMEYLSGRINIKGEWFDGDELVPVTIQDYEPRPNDRALQKGQEIDSALKEILNRL